LGKRVVLDERVAHAPVIILTVNVMVGEMPPEAKALPITVPRLKTLVITPAPQEISMETQAAWVSLSVMEPVMEKGVVRVIPLIDYPRNST
jgi:hypothetical protein